MDITEVVVSDNSLKMKVCCNIQKDTEIISPLYKMNCMEFQLKGYISDRTDRKLNISDSWNLFIKFKKCVDDGWFSTLKINSRELNLKSITFISDHSYWHEIGSHPIRTNNFYIEINVGVKTSPYLRAFVDDDSLTDFEMKGIDGSIRVHKIVLAAASEVFEKMMTNDFKENQEGRVELPYSKDVLKDFKDYLYLNTLNNDNLEHLLLLAHCYMMNELKRDCINKLFYITMTEKTDESETTVKNHSKSGKLILKK